MSKIFRSTRSSELSAAPAAFPLLENDPQTRELADRFNDGLEVTLLWHPARDELTVCGSDHRTGARFEIRPERHLALEVYYHPYCYLSPGDMSYTG
jgi:hypothetical protein